MSKTICHGIVGLAAPLAASLLALPGAAQTMPQPIDTASIDTAYTASIDTAPIGTTQAAASTQTAAPTTIEPVAPLSRLLQGSKPAAKPELIEQLASAPTTAPIAAPAAAPTAAPTTAPTTTEPVASLPRLLRDVKPIADPNLLDRLIAARTGPSVVAPTATPPTATPTVAPIAPDPLLPFSQLQQDSKLAAKPDLSERWAFPNPVEGAEQGVQLVLRLEERQLYVYRGSTLETTFPVAVGKPGWETPTGSFEVSSMLENPGWTNPFTDEVVSPGPENPLGERWISFWTDGQYEIGFHGTPNRGSVGQASSHGCVRLYNEHVRELYDMVNPGTLVTVLP